MFKRKKQPLMTFMTNMPGLAEDPLVQPQPAMKFIPDEWKKVPRFSDEGDYIFSTQRRRTIKACPSFVDWFTTGVVLPAWCDMAFKYDTKTDRWDAVAGLGNGMFTIAAHPYDQMLKYMDYKHRGDKAQLIFKFKSPWYLKTPKGYSTLQLPLFYHSTRDWQVLAGMWESDIVGQVDHQVAYFGNDEEVIIRKGEPLVHYIPFKREKISVITKFMTKEDNYEADSIHVAIGSKSGGGWLSIPREGKNES